MAESDWALADLTGAGHRLAMRGRRPRPTRRTNPTNRSGRRGCLQCPGPSMRAGRHGSEKPCPGARLGSQRAGGYFHFPHAVFVSAAGARTYRRRRFHRSSCYLEMIRLWQTRAEPSGPGEAPPWSGVVVFKLSFS
jgi:hypothetical protein